MAVTNLTNLIDQQNSPKGSIVVHGFLACVNYSVVCVKKDHNYGFAVSHASVCSVVCLFVCFGHFGSSTTSCKHNNKIISPLELIW